MEALAKIQIKGHNNPSQQEQQLIWSTEFDQVDGNLKPGMVLVGFQAMLGRLDRDVVHKNIYELSEARQGDYWGKAGFGGGIGCPLLGRE